MCSRGVYSLHVKLPNDGASHGGIYILFLCLVITIVQTVYSVLIRIYLASTSINYYYSFGYYKKLFLLSYCSPCKY